MKQFFAAIAAVMMTVLAVPASAATLNVAEVLSSDCNTTCGAAGRNDPLAVLGAPDGVFYSMGRNGSLTVGFGQTFTGPGSVVEVTYGNVSGYGVESAKVFVGDFASSLWTEVAEVFNTSAQAGFSFSFSGTFDAMKLVDTTPANCGHSRSCHGDGFDVDSISVSAVPLPAAGWLLLVGFGGLAALRRRKRAA